MASKDWDLLVGHYLGIDHAGHTFGVDSLQMLSKVQQTDREVAQVRPLLVPLCVAMLALTALLDWRSSLVHRACHGACHAKSVSSQGTQFTGRC
jgi:hypothetical protein